jgi:hypothetical protein
MIEIGVVIDRTGKPLYWHDPPGRTVVSLPDSTKLWDVLYSHGSRLMGFAHSHPGAGVPGPSWEDLTTFAAVEAGLGRRLLWWIVNGEGTVLLVWEGPGQHEYLRVPVKDPPWAEELRQRSTEA